MIRRAVLTLALACSLPALSPGIATAEESPPSSPDGGMTWCLRSYPQGSGHDLVTLYDPQDGSIVLIVPGVYVTSVQDCLDGPAW